MPPPPRASHTKLLVSNPEGVLTRTFNLLKDLVHFEPVHVLLDPHVVEPVLVFVTGTTTGSATPTSTGTGGAMGLRTGWALLVGGVGASLAFAW